MTGWQGTTTAALIQAGVIEIGDGYRAKNAEFIDGGGLPFVRVGDVGRNIRLDGPDELPQSEIARYLPKVAMPFDSLITMKGTVGRVAFVTERTRAFVYSPQISYWRSHAHDEVHPRWLRYWLEGPEFSGQASATKGSTDMADYINLRDQRRMRITIPPLDVQQRIAETLGMLDDLIENNRRRVELLEEMAGAIYREWFVYFRYPGLGTDGLVDSPLGQIPEGWRYEPLSGVATLVRGRSYRKHELVESGGMPFVNLKCMMRGGGFRRDGLKRYEGKYTEAQLVTGGDIVLAVTDLTQGREILARATLVPRLADGPGVISLDVARIIADDPAQRLWIFAALRWSDFAERVKEFANGSTVLHLSPKHVENAHLLWPPDHLRADFMARLGPMIGMIDDLTDASDRLASIRSLLLPRLVTGRIDVTPIDLNALVEEGAA